MIYCVIGYYDMNDGMTKGSELHGCYKKLEDAKEKFELVKKQILEQFKKHSDCFVGEGSDDTHWSVYGNIDMAILEIVRGIIQ